MTSYVPNIDPYIKLAAELKEKYEYEYKFIKGVTSSPDVPLYSVLLENPDGQIFEFVSVALYQARTKKQKKKNTTRLSERSFYAFSVVRSSRARFLVPTRRVELAADVARCFVRRAGCVLTKQTLGTRLASCSSCRRPRRQESSEDAFTKDECWFRPVGNFPDQSWYTDYSFEAVDMYKLGNFLNIEKYPRNYSRPFSTPSHTSIASTDPEADAEFLLKVCLILHIICRVCFNNILIANERGRVAQGLPLFQKQLDVTVESNAMPSTSAARTSRSAWARRRSARTRWAPRRTCRTSRPRRA